MANFAKLSHAVFYEEWMISKAGIRNGEYSEEYQYITDGSFEPFLSINFKTGEIRAAYDVFEGNLVTKFKNICQGRHLQRCQVFFQIRPDVKNQGARRRSPS